MTFASVIKNVPSNAASTIPPDLRTRILALERESDWDGEGAEGISLAACKAAVEFLERRPKAVPLPKSLAPSPTGAVSFYWSNGLKRLLIEISSGDAASVYFQSSVRGGERQHGIIHRDEALQSLQALYSD